MTGDGLAGVRVAVLRPSAQAGELGSALAAVGARVLHFPLIRIEPPADVEALVRVAGRLAGYDWIVFTSANAVRSLAAAVATEAGVWPPGPRVAAVGAGTAAALEAAGVAVDLVPARFEGATLAKALAAGAPLAGRRVLFPRARDARRTVPDALARAGAVVDELECYRTERDTGAGAQLHAALDGGGVDIVIFTSPSQVETFVAGGGTARQGVVFAAIGPVTAGAAGDCGLPVAVVAEPHSVPGLVAALLRWRTSGGQA